MANNGHIPEESHNTISTNHTNSSLSRRSIAQRARSKHERQLREQTLFNQDLPHHLFKSVARNLNDELNREATQTVAANPHAQNNVTKTEIGPPLALSGITMNVPNLMNHVRNNNSQLSNRSIAKHARRERERQLRETEMASNFLSSTFEIGESSSAPTNVIHHYMEEHYNSSDNDEAEYVNVNQVEVQLGRHFLGQMDIAYIMAADLDPNQVGQRVVLPSSHIDLPTPIPVLPTYHGMTDEEAAEAKNDYYQMCWFYHLIMLGEQHWVYLHLLAKDVINEADEEASVYTRKYCRYPARDWAL
ncbi:hypothetical protein GIB67_008117 [Kingdonia uniflora]|uniref:Uncharacterized protein n=1 Tax=Kingdonia uniflora TaxID=39325 RepID=A0A7J7MTG9_9MAGN|nr:hypothetical protein GIB67_008117 [Kingdonia uniflora]